MKHSVLGMVLLTVSTALMAQAGMEQRSPEWYKEYPHKNMPEAAIYRGNLVFNTYCVLCHGAKADGNGRAAKMYDPKPANLIMSDKNDDYKELIIRRGGAALARSPFMPPWGEELTDEQIADVLAFLRSVQSPKVNN